MEKFSELKYVRPDMPAIAAETERAVAALESAAMNVSASSAPRTQHVRKYGRSQNQKGFRLMRPLNVKQRKSLIRRSEAMVNSLSQKEKMPERRGLSGSVADQAAALEGSGFPSSGSR